MSTAFDLDNEARKIRSDVFLSKGRLRASATRQRAIKALHTLQAKAVSSSKNAVNLDDSVPLWSVFDVIGEAKVADNMSGYPDKIKALMIGFREQLKANETHLKVPFKLACNDIGRIEFVRCEREQAHAEFHVHPLVDFEQASYQNLGRFIEQYPGVVAAGEAAIAERAALPNGAGALPDNEFWASLRNEPQFKEALNKEVAQLSL